MRLQDKRVVVTGGAGFLGSHVVARLRELGVADVFVPRSASYDLVREEAVAQLLVDTRPELLFHLAARVGGIGANRLNPGKYFYDNTAMGLHVIEHARRFGIAKVIMTGTICSYPKFTPIPFREEDLWNGYPEETNAPYGIAKKAILVMAQAYRAQYEQNVVMALPVNLYGPRDNFDLESAHVIPALIRKCIEAVERGDQEVVLWGDGTPTREFLYVDDCAEGLIRMAERYDDPEPINLGSGHEVRIRELATKIATLCGYRGRFVWDNTRPNGQPRRCLDVSRAQERLGFVASTSLEDGLHATISWFRANRKATS
jgi:GDP-L-fucose synthase